LVEWAGLLVSKCSVKLVHGDEGLLDQTRLLWEALNRHHLALSTHFKTHYEGMTFEGRKADLLKKASAGKMRVDLAVDEKTAQTVGYCVSSLNQDKAGEVESLFVDPNYRGLGVGGMLMRAALEWMDQEGAVAKTVEVAQGNEAAFGFYAKYGFLPRKTTLKQVAASSTVSGAKKR
jgi:ribosomal protein S18 acetylase RimI-like enzyme